MNIGGHPKFALAVAEALSDIVGGNADVRVRYIFSPELVSPAISLVFGAYGRVVRFAPALWGLLFHLSQSRHVLGLIRSGISILSKKRLTRELEAWKPHLLVAVCPTFGQMAAIRPLRNSIDGGPTVVTIVTDPLVVHRSWITVDSDYYFVTSEPVYDLLNSRHGVSKSRILRGGFPVQREFRLQKGPSRLRCRQLLGIEAGVFVVLLIGGSSGVGGILADARNILERNERVCVLAVCGRNQRLLHDLQKLQARLETSKRTALRVYGWRDDMHLLMRAADAVATKAGAGTVAEALSLLRPIIFTWETPGQEQGNVRYYVEDQGIGLDGRSPQGLATQVELLLTSSETRRRLTERQTEVLKGNPTKALAQTMISLVPGQRPRTGL